MKFGTKIGKFEERIELSNRHLKLFYFVIDFHQKILSCPGRNQNSYFGVPDLKFNGDKLSTKIPQLFCLAFIGKGAEHRNLCRMKRTPIYRGEFHENAQIFNLLTPLFSHDF